MTENVVAEMEVKPEISAQLADPAVASVPAEILAKVLENIVPKQSFQEMMKAARAGVKTVAIVGMAESSRGLAPCEDPDVEIWAMNESNKANGPDGKPFLSRITRIFQMHEPFDYQRANNQNDPGHWEWLQQNTDYPVIMQEVDPLVPSSAAYPLKEIAAKYLSHYRKIGDDGKPIEFFQSTFSYMIAQAIYEGFPRIEIYGIEMASNTEYARQRGNGLFWIGIAGQYAELVFPANTGMIDGERYGYDQKAMLNRMQFEVRIISLHTERKKYAEALEKMRVEKLTISQQLKSFTGDPTRVKSLKKRDAEIEAMTDNLVQRINILTGHIDEAQFVIETMDYLGDAHLQPSGDAAPVEEVPVPDAPEPTA